MHYKPLLLAILLSFSAHSYAATEPAKGKAAAVKKADKKKEQADSKADKKKEQADSKADKKKTAKDDDAPKSGKAGKAAKSKDNDDDKSKKSVGKTAKDKDDEPAVKSKKNAKNKDDDNDKRKTGKAAPAKAEKASVEKDKPSSAKKNKADDKDDVPSKKGKTKAVKDKEDDKQADKNDKKDSKEAAKKETAKEKKERLKKEKAEQAPKAEETRESKAKSKGKNKDKESSKETKDNKEPSSAKLDDDMRRAISAATNEVEDKKALNRQADAMLVRVSSTLSQTRSSLSSINRQQRDAWDKFQKLNTDLGRLKADVSNMRAQISRFISGNYKNSQPNAVALFLKKAEPGQKTRFLTYTRYINAANEKVVADLSRQQKELSAQESKINAELVRLKKLQNSAQASLKRQGVKNSEEQTESRRQNAKMAKEAQKVVSQKDSEQRLNTLLEDINKRKAEQRKKEAEARKKAAEERLAAAEKARKAKAAAQKEAEAERAALSNLTDEDMKLAAPEYIRMESQNSFSRMQGRLHKPVQGNLAGLFGHDRGDGEVWKGVFYQTSPTQVNAIAAGTVAYAGDLEGYGKVIVIDHGDKYVSVYSGMSDISVAEGYAVPANSKIGTSGKLPSGEEGLYLEIRYDGQNMNPLSWIV